MLAKLEIDHKNHLGIAAVSFLRSALVWLDRIVSWADGTGLGTGFISQTKAERRNDTAAVSLNCLKYV